MFANDIVFIVMASDSVTAVASVVTVAEALRLVPPCVGFTAGVVPPLLSRVFDMFYKKG